MSRTQQTANVTNDGDTLTVGGSKHWLNGGLGGDTLTGIYQRNVGDKIEGDAGADAIYGKSGHDKLYGNNKKNTNPLLDGIDTIYGGTGNDEIHGHTGNDDLYGGSDNDKIYGGEGDDTMDGNQHNDLLHGGEGNDTLKGSHGIDDLYGDAGNDKLYGNGGNDKLYGGAGNDTLYGGIGNDTLDGGAGDDIFMSRRANNGKDTMTGGDGADTFSFLNNRSGTIQKSAASIIKDFESGTDKINLIGRPGKKALVKQDGDDTLVVRGKSNSPDIFVILEGITATDLTADDFTGLTSIEVL